MKSKAIRNHAKPAAAAGLVLLALVSSVVIARSAETQGLSARPHPDNAVVQDTALSTRASITNSSCIARPASPLRLKEPPDETPGLVIGALIAAPW